MPPVAADATRRAHGAIYREVTRQAQTLAYLWQGRRYRDIPIREQVEVLSLAGDIAESGDGPVVHAHAVLGRADGAAP